MVKVKSISKRRINFGVIDNKMLYFNPKDEKELPDTEFYSELVANAIDDGFLEIVEKKTLFSKKEDTEVSSKKKTK